MSNPLNDGAKDYIERQVEQRITSAIEVVDKITCIFGVHIVDHGEKSQHHNEDEAIEQNGGANHKFVIIGEKESHFRLTEK